MATPRELADRAAALARDAISALVEIAGPQGAEVLKAAARHGGPIDMRDLGARETWERHAVTPLLLAAEAALEDASGEPEEPAVRDLRAYFEARAALRDGDVQTARRTLEHLQSVASQPAPDDWDHGNVTHNSHILAGLLNLEDGLVDEAAADLHQAGQARPTPQLMSFGPDLTLAWALLKLGRDDDALSYFRAVSAFWSPQAFG